MVSFKSINDRPTPSGIRINELDIFRGFAILGIFMVNILVMNVCFLYREEWEAEQMGWIQSASFFILENFFYSKFYTIFSLLFGIGVAIQFRRSMERKTYQRSFFLRRFISLFLFGVLHIVFIWAGDILHLYGMMGLMLMFFFKLPKKILLWISILVFLFPFYGFILQEVYNWLDFNNYGPLSKLSRETIIELKHNGSYFSGIILRLKEYAFASELIYAGIAPIAFSMMLLGGYLVKKNVFDNIPFWVKRVQLPLLISLGILLVYRFTILYWVVPNFNLERGSALSIFLMTIFQLSDIALSLSFLWTIAYLYQKDFFRKILFPLSYVGRMAFSNYILQSVLGYLIMRTFNFYESFSAFGCILLVIGIYLFQIVISKWWLKRFQFGPLEWLWRCISYWKLLSIRLK